MADDGPIHIALAFDDNFWAPAYAVMRSICLFTKRKSDLVFHLCHETLTPDHRADLEAIATEFPAQMVWYDLDQSPSFKAMTDGLPSQSNLPKVIYARLMLGRLLDPAVERVIYLDCDVMVRAPIEDLYGVDLGGHAIGAIRDTLGSFLAAGVDMRQKRDLFDVADPYFNSGVLVIDLDRWRAAEVPEKLAQVVADGTMMRLFYDQDFLNLVFKNAWQRLPPTWNMIDPRVPNEGLDPSILHYTGPAKPWYLVTNVAFRRIYRHVMTNDVFYRFMRHRWKRYWLKLLRLRS
jgi:lipopolysaccharide biosynthesis glycosyltransferase